VNLKTIATGLLVGMLATMSAFAQSTKQSRPVQVFFLNNTAHESEVRIGNMQYTMLPLTMFHTYVPLGTVVHEYSNETPALSGTFVIQVKATDAGTNVFLK
jgi:hypothetical protein